MMIEKLNYSETMYPDRVEKLCYILEEKLDHVTLEYVKALAEHEQAKSAAALTSRNNSVRENEAERLQDYAVLSAVTAGWTIF